MDPRREPQFERQLPSSPEAERAVLGAIILDNGLIEQAISLLMPTDFYTPSHREIYCAMIELYEKSTEINPILIGEVLQRYNPKGLEAAGGLSFITNLTYGLPHSTNIKHYAEIIRGKALLRWGIKEAARISEACYEEDDEPNVIINYAAERFSEMRERTAVNGHQGGMLKDLVPAITDHLYVLKAGINPAIATGFPSFDKKTGGGITPGELWGIGALSSQGKTSLLLQWLRHMTKHGTKAVLFSLEMRALLNALRILAAETKVPMHRIRYGITDMEIARLLQEVSKALDLPLWIYTDCRSVSDIKARIKSLKRKDDIKVCGIDYYGLLNGYGAGRDRYENRTQELKYIASALQQQIAIEQEVGVIVPAQFNRSAWNNQDPGPGSIDGGEAYYQACDMYATLKIKPKKGETKSEGYLKIFKQRNGPTGTIKLKFQGADMEFFEVDDDAEEEPEKADLREALNELNEDDSASFL